MIRFRRRPTAFHRALSCAILVLVPYPLASQTGPTGRVLTQDGAPVAFANVAVSGSHATVLARTDGRFVLPALPPGRHRLVVSAVGYGTIEVELDLPGDGRPLEFVLSPDPVGLDALTVTGTMKRSRVSDSPVKVEVVPAVVLQRAATNNLTEAIQYLNGLNAQIDCGVCYTNSIRINGMEGPYTAILIDGMPLMSSLASVYGLNGINPALIEQVEIIKGPASTLYGSEAMAGVVNVITKDPRFAPRLAVDIHGSSEGERNVDFALARSRGDVSGFLSGNIAYNQRFVDGNADGFSDFPLVRRGVLFGKLDVAPDGIRRAGLSLKYLGEDRFGGVEAWTPADRGSDRVYGESIYTHRFEAIGFWTPGFSDRVRIESSYTYHNQDSYYGDVRYDARQQIAVGNLIWSAGGGGHDLLGGVSLRFQTYDDNTPATVERDERFTPGLFLQDEVEWTSRLTTLGGIRVDHHDDHGVILSPRLAVKWEPFGHTTVRLNAGTGFRVVNLFTEDHAALTGAREVVIESDLQPERSRSVTVNLNQVVEFGPNPMMIDLDLFHTHFHNRITPDYDVDPNQIVYANLRGSAVSRGVSLSFNQNVDFDRILYSVGVTLQEVYLRDEGIREDQFHAPSVRGTFSATYNFERWPVTVDYTGTVTGPMRLPSYDEPFARPDRSPTFSLHNLRAAWRGGTGLELYAAVNNVFDHVQPSALIDPANPFGDAFDTAYVYGPLRGRSLIFGIRYGVAQ